MMYMCEICGFEVDEIDDIEWIPTPSVLDPGAHTRMCRDCAGQHGVGHYFDDILPDEEDDDLDPLFIEEMFPDDELH